MLSSEAIPLFLDAFSTEFDNLVFAWLATYITEGVLLLSKLNTFSIYYNYYWAKSFAIDMFLLSITLLLMSDLDEALSPLTFDYRLKSAVFYYYNSIYCLNSGDVLLYSF